MGLFDIEFEIKKPKINWCLFTITIIEFISIICVNSAPSAFNPPPVNYSYIHMFTAFWLSLILCNIYEMMKQQGHDIIKLIKESINALIHSNESDNEDDNNSNNSSERNEINGRKLTIEIDEDDVDETSKRPHSFDILIDFQLFLSFSQMMLNFYIQNYWLAMLWTIQWCLCLFYRGLNWSHFSLKYPKFNLYPQQCTYDRKFTDNIPIGLVVFLSGFACLLIFAPVFQPWDRVQDYVRWYPLNLEHELLFRGVFATFAIFYLLSCFTRYSYYRSFLLFQIVVNFIHPITMMADLAKSTQGNGNVEHLYGGIICYLLICTNS